MNISFAIIIVYMALLIGISLLSGRLSSALAFLMCKKLRRTGVSTTSQIFIRLFNRFDGIVSSVIQVVVAFGINALQAIAGGAILTALLPQYFNMTNGVIISALVFTAIALFGGYMGATLTNGSACLRVWAR